MDAGGFVLLIGLGALYFTPSICAFCSKKVNAGPIFALNVLAGWTFIGWIVALIWAMSGYVDGDKVDKGKVKAKENNDAQREGKAFHLIDTNTNKRMIGCSFYSRQEALKTINEAGIKLIDIVSNNEGGSDFLVEVPR